MELGVTLHNKKYTLKYNSSFRVKKVNITK